MRSTATEIAIKTANTARIATTAATTKGTRSMKVGKAMTGNGIVATVMTTATGETTNPIPVTVATTTTAAETDSCNSRDNIRTTEPQITEKAGLARSAQHQENQMPTTPIVIVGCSSQGRPRLRQYQQAPRARPSLHFQIHGKSIGLKSTDYITFGIAILAKAHGGHPPSKVAHYLWMYSAARLVPTIVEG